MDFYILTLPKSGSHMLASALDSHPEICCQGEVWREKPLYDWLGNNKKRINGGIIPPGQTDVVPVTTKMIVLTRNRNTRLLSKHSGLGANHTLEPVNIRPAHVLLNQQELDEARIMEGDLFKAVVRFPHITLDYDEITGGQDIREIPESIGRCIGEFLNVKYHVMKPKFYKPRRAA